MNGHALLQIFFKRRSCIVYFMYCFNNFSKFSALYIPYINIVSSSFINLLCWSLASLFKAFTAFCKAFFVFSLNEIQYPLLLLLLLLLKFIYSCTCTRTIVGQQQHETVTATTKTAQSNLHKLLKRSHISYTTGKCEHFIWKAHCPLYTSSDVLGGISNLSVHFTWQVDLFVHFIWKWPNSALHHKMSILGGIWSHCALHLTSWPSYSLHVKTWPNSVTIFNGLSLKT